MPKSIFRKPRLESFVAKAKRLQQKHRDCDPSALNLIKYNHDRFIQLAPADIAESKFSSRDAQLVIAKVDGYAGWSQLKAHLKKLGSGRDNPTLLFERAAHAIVEGDLEALNRLLKKRPQLVEDRSARAHRCTLLHYIAANGIEQHRQKTPRNAVAIAELLLECGAEADALAETYGGGSAQTTLSLLVSSYWPHAAGLQGDLVKLLCRYGAKPDGLEDNCLPMATALVFFYGDTVKGLARSGARTDHLLAALAFGKAADVDRCFTKSGRLAKENFVYMGFELRRPKNRLEMLGQAFAYGGMCGNLPAMKRLVEKYGCPVDAPADRGIRALHLAAYQGHAKVVDWLLKQGADARIRDSQWNSTPIAWAYQKKQTRIRNKMISTLELTIHEAVSFFRIASVRKLLKQNPQLANSVDANGLYPIHCLHDDTEDGEAIIKALHQAGANLLAIDSNGRTALQRLRVHGRKDLIQVIEDLMG